MSNGGDNIGVYIPLFTQYNYFDLVVMVLIYLIMIGILCLVSYLIIKNKYVNKGIKKYQALIVPIVLILIGVMIIIKIWDKKLIETRKTSKKCFPYFLGLNGFFNTPRYPLNIDFICSLKEGTGCFESFNSCNGNI